MCGWGMKIHILTLLRYAGRVIKNYTVIYHGERGDQVLNNKFYRLAYEYHKKWSSRIPATAEEWQQAALEAAQTCADNGNDKFLIDLFVAVYSDLERQYKAERGEKVA